MADQATRDKQYRVVQMLAFAILIAAPILYLVVAYLFQSPESKPEIPRLPILFVLLGVAVLQLVVVIPIVIHRVLRSAQQRTRDGSQRAATVMMVTMVRMISIETVFMLGLLYFIITLDFTPMLYFYAIGLIAILLYWPTRERFDDLANLQEAP